MTDESLRGDELVSAYLDGEATPAEIAEVEQDVALMARVEQLRAVRDAVAAPVPAMSEEQRDQMISAALAVATEEAAERREAKIVPIRRRREALLAVAAAAMLLAAVVSAGLIASRGGDDDAETAADASAAFDVAAEAEPEAAAPAEAAPAPTTAPTEAEMAMADDSADYAMDEEERMAVEEPAIDEAAVDAPEAAMAEEEPAIDEAAVDAPEAAMAEEEPAIDEAAVDALEAAMAEAEAAMAEPESAMEEPAEEVSDPPVSATDTAEEEPRAEEERHAAADAAQQVVDLGTAEDLDSLFEDIAASWSAALEDGATAAPGACSAAVNERAFAVDLETGHAFIAAVGAEDPLAFDGLFARRADGTAIIVYAASPGCEVGVHELDEPDGS